MSKRVITIDLLSDDEDLPQLNNSEAGYRVVDVVNVYDTRSYSDGMGQAARDNDDDDDGEEECVDDGVSHSSDNKSAPVLPTISSIDLTQDSASVNSPIDVTTPVEKSSQSVLSSPQSNYVAAVMDISEKEMALQSVLKSGRGNCDRLNHATVVLNTNYATHTQDDNEEGAGGIMSYDGGMYTDYGDTCESYNDDYTLFNNEDSNWTSMSVNSQSSMMSNVPMSQMSDSLSRGHSYSSSQISSQKELKENKRKEKQSQKEALRVGKIVESFEERRARGKFADKEVSVVMDRTFRTGGGNKETVSLAHFIEDELLQGEFSVLLSPNNVVDSNLCSLRALHPTHLAANAMSDECCGLFMWTWRKAQLNTADRTGKDIIASYGNFGESDTEVLPFVFIYIPTQLYQYFIYGGAKAIDKMNYKSPAFDSWMAAIRQALRGVHANNYRIVLSTIGVHDSAASNGQNAHDTFTVYLLLEHNIDVYHCKDKRECCDVLRAFHRSMLLQKYYVPPTELDFLVKPKTAMSEEKREELSQSQSQHGSGTVDIRSRELQETWINVLTSVPGLSRPMAKSLVSHYSCPAKLYRALMDESLSVKERQLLLQDKLRDGDKGKQPKMSKLLYKIFTSTDPDEEFDD